jgi:AcrR family transcriptional regulator
MSLKNPDTTPQRRRGRALEDALLDAAWDEMSERGYDAFTFDAVAARAGTSRAVLYRRWPSKPELIRAAVMHTVQKDRVSTPDTGSLREDVITWLGEANEKRARLVTIVMTRLGDFYTQSETNIAELGTALDADAFLKLAVQRAVERGEIPAHPINDRIIQLPAHLFRYEALTSLRPVPHEVIEEIVDTIYLPLLGAGKT